MIVSTIRNKTGGLVNCYEGPDGEIEARRVVIIHNTLFPSDQYHMTVAVESDEIEFS